MSDTPQEELSRDLVFDILSSPRRRYMLYYLRQADQPVHIQELSAEVASWENEIPVEELTDQQQKRVYVSLYQTHIPKLEDAGIVRYDQEAGTVELTGRADEMEAYIGGREEREIPWQLAYLALAVAGVLLFAAVVFEVGAFAALSAAAAGIVISAAFAVLALVHFLVTRWPGRTGALERLEEDR